MPSREYPPARLTAVVVLGCLVLLLAAASIQRISAHDFWWQYSTGRLVAEQGIPHHDVFSYTARGSPWIELRWVYCWLLYQGVEHLGPSVVSLAPFVILLASFALVVAPTIRADRIGSAAVVLLFALLAASGRFFIRPELLTYLLFAAYLRIIERYRRQGGRAIYVLPFLQVIWVNSHTLFALGPALVGLLCVDSLFRSWRVSRSIPAPDSPAGSPRQTHRPLIVLALTLAACLVNPYGFRSIPFAIQLLTQIHGTVFKDTILEFRSPFAYGAGIGIVLYYEIFLGVVVLSAMLNIKRLDFFWTVLVLAMGYLSAVAVRNVPLFCLAGAPFAIVNLGVSSIWTQPIAVRIRRPLRTAACLGVIGACAVFGRQFAANRVYLGDENQPQSGFGLARHRDPEASARRLIDARLDGPVFSTFGESAYLIAQRVPVFVDGRLEVYGPDKFSRYLDIIKDDDGWRAGEAEFGFRGALISLQSRIVNLLWSDPRWRLIGFDEVAAAFVRDDLPSAPPALRVFDDMRAAAAAVRDRLPAPRTYDDLGPFEPAAIAAPYANVGTFLMALGLPGLAEPFLIDAIRAGKTMPGARKYLGQIHESRGDIDAAMREYAEVVRLSPDDLDAKLRLANDYLIRRRPADASGLIDSVIAAEPANARAWALRGGAFAADRNWPAAISAMQRAGELDPDNPQYRDFLAAFKDAAASPRS